MLGDIVLGVVKGKAERCETRVKGGQRDIGYLEGLNECPEQCPDSFTLTEKLDQPHNSEETKEGDGNAGTVLRALELGVWWVCSTQICPSHLPYFGPPSP